MRPRSLALLLAILVTTPAWAHHGRDFLIVESYELPHPGTFYFVSSEEFDHLDGGNAFHTQPSLLFGIRERVAGEVHVHAERLPGESFQYESIAPAIHVELTPPESTSAWRFAGGAEYEIARHSDENNLTITLIAQRSIGNAVLIANGGAEHDATGGTHAIYAVGYRPELDVPLGWGIEAAGTIRHGESHQLIFGLYTQPMKRLTIKIGAGAGFGTGRPAAVVRSGIVWSF